MALQHEKCKVQVKICEAPSAKFKGYKGPLDQFLPRPLAYGPAFLDVCLMKFFMLFLHYLY